VNRSKRTRPDLSFWDREVAAIAARHRASSAIIDAPLFPAPLPTPSARARGRSLSDFVRRYQHGLRGTCALILLVAGISEPHALDVDPAYTVTYACTADDVTLNPVAKTIVVRFCETPSFVHGFE
jgi:hypothetical protein